MLFKEITGHEAIKQQLIQTVRDNRVSHAQLFLGPEGSGKFAMAMAYAQYINCTSKQNGDACGVCPSCMKYKNLAHPDLHFIYPVNTTREITKNPTSKNFIKEWRTYIMECDYFPQLNDWYTTIGIEKKQGLINKDDCNEIIRSLGYKSYESEYTVLVIWMAEKIYYSAAPKILKILEEPPEKTLFLLIAENQDQIISTILSRTQIINIPKLERQSIEKMLQLKSGFPENEARRAAGLANGNYILARKYAETSERDQFNFDTFSNWMRLCYKNDLISIEKLISELSGKSREELKSLFSYALKITRYCMHYSTNNKKQVNAAGKELEFIENFSAFVNHKNAAEFATIFNTAYLHIERNANHSLLLMDISLNTIKMIAPKVQKDF